MAESEGMAAIILQRPMNPCPSAEELRATPLLGTHLIVMREFALINGQRGDWGGDVWQRDESMPDPGIPSGRGDSSTAARRQGDSRDSRVRGRRTRAW